MPMTVFACRAPGAVADWTARVYTYAVMPYMAFLDTDEWERRAGRTWDNPPDAVRQSVRAYLRDYLSCKIERRRDREKKDRVYQLVSTNARTYPDTDIRPMVRSFLAGISLFYNVMIETKRYHHPHPLEGVRADTIEDAQKGLTELMAWLDRNDDDAPHDGDYPTMPQQSGTAPTPPRHGRLTDKYFVLAREEWMPQAVTDKALPGLIDAAGRKSGWKERDRIVATMLFESGGRISEVVGVTLGDWATSDFGKEMSAFNKGSHMKRKKFFLISEKTRDRLKAYVDGERRACDPDGCTLADFMALARRRNAPLSLYRVPLFLTNSGTRLTAKHWRDYYWTRMCQAGGIDVDPHQARHWYVTQAIEKIHEDERKGEKTVKEGEAELIAYMKWAWGEETLKAYNHYFDAARHADTADAVHAKVAAATEEAARHRRRPGRPRKDGARLQAQRPAVGAADTDLEELFSLGG